MWPFTKKQAEPLSLKQMMHHMLIGYGAPNWTGHNFQQLAQEGYERNPIVYACVTKLAKALVSVDVQLFSKRGGKLTKIEQHPLLDLLNRPNPAMSGMKFMEAIATDLLIGGNIYISRDGEPSTLSSVPPKELYRFSPAKVTIKKGNYIFPSAYEYRPYENNSEVITYPVEQINGTSNIIHIKTPNPRNGWEGLPPLVAAAYGVDIFNHGQQWNMSLLQNGARPSGAMTVKTEKGMAATLTDEQYSRVKEQIDEQMSGARNAGRPMLLEGGLEWKEMSLSPKDMEFRDNMLVNARFIASAYHTPPQLVGIPGESTYSNYAEAKLAYWADTVLPTLSWLLDSFNHSLVPLFGDDLYLWYDEEMIPALEPLRTQKSTRINGAMFMTINEKRQAMGLDTLGEEADVVLVPSSVVPLDYAGELPNDDTNNSQDANDED